MKAVEFPTTNVWPDSGETISTLKLVWAIELITGLKRSPAMAKNPNILVIFFIIYLDNYTPTTTIKKGNKKGPMKITGPVLFWALPIGSKLGIDQNRDRRHSFVSNSVRYTNRVFHVACRVVSESSSDRVRHRLRYHDTIVELPVE